MAILIHPEGKIEINGRFVPRIDEREWSRLQDMPATAQTPLSDILSRCGFPGGIDGTMRAAIASDDALTRGQLSKFDEDLANACTRAGLPKLVEQVRRTMADSDLKDGAKLNRCVDAAGPVLAEIKRGIDVAMEKPHAALATMERMISDALEPEPLKGDELTARTIRAWECRQFFASADPNVRAQFWENVIKSEALESLSAIENDPCVRGLESAAQVSLVKVRLLQRMRVEFLLMQLDQARANLRSAAHRADALEGGIIKGMEAIGMKHGTIKPDSFHMGLAHKALDLSEGKLVTTPMHE